MAKQTGETKRRVPAGKPRHGAAEGVPATAGDQVIDFDRYVPTVVSRFMSKLKVSSNAFFSQRYGLTLLEWRIISFLAADGASSAYEIWTKGSLDKAAVSRALRALKARGLIEVRDVKAVRRKKTSIDLTQKGRELHAATFAEVVVRHERLVNGLSKAEIESFLRTVKYLEGRIALMESAVVDIPSGFQATKSVAPRAGGT